MYYKHYHSDNNYYWSHYRQDIGSLLKGNQKYGDNNWCYWQHIAEHVAVVERVRLFVLPQQIFHLVANVLKICFLVCHNMLIIG